MEQTYVALSYADGLEQGRRARLVAADALALAEWHRDIVRKLRALRRDREYSDLYSLSRRRDHAEHLGCARGLRG